ncbi:MAG: 4-(cytidine 5'-diphospho)-2-C-methyl-D-erythritol kinase [Lachnospiraceae bacterium]|nr:4-(cytidine 5'-diphospho)-2-C-methyl-D-erythritol kinase [Lachnospiraceae bacterium]
MVSRQMDTLEIKAYAKINLGLDVVRRLANGYHEVKMIMQTVGIYDTLTLQKTKPGIKVTTDSGEVPADESNLVYKAARLLTDTCQIKEGIAIHLEKRIPVAAGMAGGSTDAAAVLKGMNTLFSLGLSEEELKMLGVKLGADIPYCIMGGTALAEGIGERLEKLPPAPACFLLIAKPDINVSTKYVYENLKLSEIKKHPDIDGMKEAVKTGSLQGITSRMENVLESVTEEKYPVIKKLKLYMEENGALKALMSGSGPTVFGIYEREEDALAAKEKLTGSGLAKQLFVTTFA